MAATIGTQFRTLAAALHHQKLNVRCNQLCSLLQIRNYAARKGTREKARKKKVKVEVKKVGFIPHNLRVKKSEIIPINLLRTNDSWKAAPVDDVWFSKFHRWKTYSVAEAIECHRETHHPTCYNSPTAFINAHVELDLQGDKPTKTIDSFTRTVSIPYQFDHGESRSVMAFAKSPEVLDLAEKAGATIFGDIELITKIQKGDVSVSDYSAVVAHPEIMAELSVIRGLMKRKFPNPRMGTLGLDIAGMVSKILHGIKYTAKPHERQKLYGTITVPIGQLSMDTKHLEENLAAILKDIQLVRPKRQGQFITRVRLVSPPSKEMFKINFEQYFGNKDDDDDSSDDDEEILRSNVI